MSYSASNQDDPFSEYKVVVNHEDQYSIWPMELDMPTGWRSAGKSGTKQECLDYIETIWTDMRPLSLREAMADSEQNK